jgi:hypothetical protein
MSKPMKQPNPPGIRRALTAFFTIVCCLPALFRGWKSLRRLEEFNQAREDERLDRLRHPSRYLANSGP